MEDYVSMVQAHLSEGDDRIFGFAEYFSAQG
jgi:hypothetical protein